ncbi:hypothetical protein HPMG_01707 [Helicobacter pullorum MIT 98-5489]|uniref:Uncharacterized protein n=2 Tax=Helicobacter pullorum TaxID=35818 RepID=C5F1V6_9HELI|nr:hypothetical protein HPMG_01707 [Helicobacter pullorum MIT 98-5489]KPH51404.1 hypothetical protein HPU229254_07085 [Helicobacter pullorum]
MEKTFFKNLYHSIITSLYFGITLILIRILPFEWLDYSLIYDILAMCCGFVSAFILKHYTRFKAICFIIPLFIVYFLFFKVPFVAIMTALCAIILQILSVYLQDKIKIFFISIIFGALLLIAYSGDYVRLTFLLQFVFWWHILWFILLFVAFKIQEVIKW